MTLQTKHHYNSGSAGPAKGATLSPPDDDVLEPVAAHRLARLGAEVRE